MDISNTTEVTRFKEVLTIKAREVLKPNEDGYYLEDGYTYDINCALPELAIAFSVMLTEMDKDTDFGDKTGAMLLFLINENYKNANEYYDNVQRDIKPEQ